MATNPVASRRAGVCCSTSSSRGRASHEGHAPRAPCARQGGTGGASTHRSGRRGRAARPTPLTSRASPARASRPTAAAPRPPAPTRPSQQVACFKAICRKAQRFRGASWCCELRHAHAGRPRGVKRPLGTCPRVHVCTCARMRACGGGVVRPPCRSSLRAQPRPGGLADLALEEDPRLILLEEAENALA